MWIRPIIAPLRVIWVTVSLGLAFSTLSVLAFHYLSIARTTSSENMLLKDQVRGLIERLVEVEATMQAVSAAQQQLDTASLQEFTKIIGNVGIEADSHGRLYRATIPIASYSNEQDSRVRRVSANGGNIYDRMANAKHLGNQLQTKLSGTAEAVADRQQILRSLPSILPADGWISSTYGVRKSPFHIGADRMHNGLDVAAPEGSAVYATAEGTVTYAGQFGAYGKLVRIDHGFGITTKYAHNAEIIVKKGDQVERGQMIAKVGSTGRSTGSHVHYEVSIHDHPVDPQRFLFEADLNKAIAAKHVHAPMGGEENDPREEMDSEVNRDWLVAAKIAPQFDDSERQTLPITVAATEWDQQVFTADKGMIFSILPQSLQNLTATDLATACVLFILFGISGATIRWPSETIGKLKRSRGQQWERILTPEERLLAYARRFDPSQQQVHITQKTDKPEIGGHNKAG